MLEVNTLGETLHRQRLDALEATALLSKVMEEIDVAAFTFDGNTKLRLVNRGGERLLGKPSDELIDKTAAELGIEQCLEGETPRLMDHTFTGLGGRWELRRSVFRENGLPHQLVVLSDLTRALRHEERQAWQRLVQVLRHEINNSLAPIQSLSGTMRRMLTRKPRAPDWEKDLSQSLSIISERSGALSRFMASYAKLTHLPKPRPATLDVAAWVERVARLETRLPVEVLHGPPLTISADGDQLDQLLINLVRNAVDAALETGGGVRVGWETGRAAEDYVEVRVQDDGPGLSNTDNLFVPFFTTKPQGSGIGLVLCRQIAEAHGGNLTLVNREAASGCEARLRLPV
jgi:PAS domain S-box-containing protein